MNKFSSRADQERVGAWGVNKVSLGSGIENESERQTSYSPIHVFRGALPGGQGEYVLNNLSEHLIQPPESLNVLVGPPGCGKTTTLGELVTRAVDRGWQPLICSLTRAAAREVAGRELPIDPGRVGTLHAHAYRALGGPKIAEGEIASWNDWLTTKPRYRSAWNIPPSYGKRRRVEDPKDEPREVDDAIFGTDGIELYERIGVYRACLVPEERWPSMEARGFYAAWCAWKAEAGFSDFADLIEDCFEQGIGPEPFYDALYVDEAQDLSRAEMRLVMAWASRARETVVVGDPWQNLYAWRGSEPDVFTALLASAKRTRTLEQSYRVSRAVHAAAMAWASPLAAGVDIRYLPRDAEGRADVSCLSFGDHTLAILADEIEERALSGRTVMALAACSYQLDALVRELRKRGLPFHNPYRVTNGAWNPLGQAHKPGSGPGRLLAFSRVRDDLWGADARFWTADEIAGWAAPLDARVFTHGSKKRLEAREVQTPDQLAECVRESDDLGAMFAGDLDWYDQHLLPSAAKTLAYPLACARTRGLKVLAERPKVTVGTVHSVKGGESSSVFLAPDLSPAGYEEWSRGDRDSVRRQFYVGMTRARDELVLCKASGHRQVHWP